MVKVAYHKFKVSIRPQDQVSLYLFQKLSKDVLERGKNLEFLIKMVCRWFDVILSKVNEKLNRVLNNTAAENKWLLE